MSFRIGLLLCLFTSIPATATVIDVQLSATITQVDPLLAGAFSVGQVLAGSHRFESTTADSAGDPSTGL